MLLLHKLSTFVFPLFYNQYSSK